MELKMTNRDRMIQALHEFKDANGHAKMRSLLESVAGVTAISAVPDDKIDAVIKACGGAPSASAKAGGTLKTAADIDVDAIYARWNSAGKRGDAS
jgi:hypothetical protein